MPHLVQSSDAVSVGAVNNICHDVPVLLFGVFGLVQHRPGLLRVTAGAGSQELGSPVKPHPLPENRGRAYVTSPVCCFINSTHSDREQRSDEGEGDYLKYKLVI